MQPNQEQIAHLLWCILVAIRTAVENHEIKSETGKRKFIAEWLRGARRHDSYREMGNEFQTIRQLLTQDLNQPIDGTINALWMNAVSSVGCDLFRFKAALNGLNRLGWRHSLCPWPELVASELFDRQKGRSNHILQLTRMEEAFSPVGAMTSPVTFQLIIKKNTGKKCQHQVEETFHSDSFSVVHNRREITIDKATIRTVYIGHQNLPESVWGMRDSEHAGAVWKPNFH